MTDIALLSAAREAERTITAAQLRAAHPHLIPVSAASNSLVAAAKNIRRELAARFPRVKFAVRSSRFSGGDSIRVSWTDGTTAEQVDAIIGRYRAGTFDGMTDCYQYTGSAWGDTFGCAKYVHTERDFSDALIARILARLHRYWCEPDVPVPTVADFRSGRLWASARGAAISPARSQWPCAGTRSARDARRPHRSTQEPRKRVGGAEIPADLLDRAMGRLAGRKLFRDRPPCLSGQASDRAGLARLSGARRSLTPTPTFQHR